jgi:Tol biopolymer transport system component
MPRGPEGYAIYAGSLGSRQVKKIMTAQSAVIYAAPGYLLSRRNGKLAAQRFDAKRLEVHGDPVLLGDAPMESDIDGEPIASASDDGRLVTLRNPPRDTQLRWLDRTGAPRGILPLPNGTWMGGVLSPDDRFAAVSNGTDLWRVELGRGLPLRLTSGNGVHTDPVWSPDGRQIAYTRSGRGREEIVIMNSDGSGEPKVLPSTDHLFKLATDWSSAGLMLAVIDNRTLRDVILVPYPEGGAPRPIAATSSVEAFGKVSPDRRWVAYMSNEAGPLDVYLKTFPEGAHKTRVTNGGVDSFWWMPGGTELCYRTQDGIQMMSVKLTRRGEDMEVEDPRVLFRYPPDAQWSDMTHDGERFLVTISSEAARSRRAHVILNWPAMMGH